MKKIVQFVILVGACLIIAGLGTVVNFVYNSSSTADVIFELKPGSSFIRVSKELKARKVISNTRYFRLLAMAMGKTRKIRVGEYEIPKGTNPLGVLNIIVSGKSVEFSLTIQEGLNMYEIGSLMEAQGIYTKEQFLAACTDRNLIRELLGQDIDSLEGYLFPDTYRLTKYTALKDLIRVMVSRALAVYTELAETYSSSLNRHDIITLASIVEKETGSASDRGRIASVFHNRLKKRMRLQSDPTILYGIIDKTGKAVQNIRKKDINAYTKYNTYRVPRLPSGPISNPGKAAIQATFQPDETNFLYFVSRNDGTTQFSRTLTEHNRAVRTFQLNEKARQGKSWRDLKSSSKQ